MTTKDCGKMFCKFFGVMTGVIVWKFLDTIFEYGRYTSIQDIYKLGGAVCFPENEKESNSSND